MKAQGPWAGVTPDQGKTFILRAMLAFKQREDGWPTAAHKGGDPLLGGCSWNTAVSYLYRIGTTLSQLRGRFSFTKAVIKSAADAYKEEFGDWPNSASGTSGNPPFDGLTWGAACCWLRSQHKSTLSRFLRPRVELTADYIRECGHATFSATQRWPTTKDKGPMETDSGYTWVSAKNWCSVNGTTLAEVFGLDVAPPPTWSLALVKRAVHSFTESEGRVPQLADRSPVLNGRTFISAKVWMKANGHDIAALLGREPPTPAQSYTLEDIESEAQFVLKNGCFPTKARKERWRDGVRSWSGANDWLKRHNPRAPSLSHLFHPNKVRGVTPEEWSDRIANFCVTKGRDPSATSKDIVEAALGHKLHQYRKGRRVDLLSPRNVAMVGDKGRAVRAGRNKRQFSSLGEFTSLRARNWPAGADDTFEGETGQALRSMLSIVHRRPTAARGLGEASDVCQVRNFRQSTAEIEHDCWRFTLKGARKPDPRKWAAILASGDNKLIESAERIAFLDWENPDSDAPRVGYGGGQAPATRRPWSPPATQPEAGKPAPAKGNGKRAS